MTVISVTEIADGRRSENVTTRSGTETRHTKVFRVITDDRNDADLDILFAPDLPQIGDVHPDDELAVCRNQSPTPGGNNSPFVWNVRILYSTAFSIQNDPTDDAPRVSWSTQQFQTAFIVDIDGDGVVNSAGDPFDPPVQKDDSRWSATTSVNLTVVPANILLLKNAINSSIFTIDGIEVAAQHGFMYGISIGEQQSRNGFGYRVLSYTIQLKDADEGAWVISIPDMGFNELVDDKPREILQGGADDTPPNPNAGEPFSSPRQLNGSGVAIAAPTALTTVFIDFDAYPLLDFNSIPGIA